MCIQDLMTLMATSPTFGAHCVLITVICRLALAGKTEAGRHSLQGSEEDEGSKRDREGEKAESQLKLFPELVYHQIRTSGWSHDIINFI